jgi:hypothetical protein
MPPMRPKQLPPQEKNETIETMSQVVACFFSSALGDGAGGG